MGPRAGLDRCGKSRPPPGFEPRTVVPVASRYTDCAISASRRVIVRSEMCQSLWAVCSLILRSVSGRRNLELTAYLHFRGECTDLIVCFCNDTVNTNCVAPVE